MEVISGPKLKDDAIFLFSVLYNFSARIIYPARGSITCCQGLVDSGFLISILLFLTNALDISGTILLADQSPPPITLPARAEAINI